MKKHQRSAIVPFTAGQMYALVADVPAYGEFLPWCGGARVDERRSNDLLATIDIAFKGIHKSFTTRNQFVENEWMDMRLVSGPFSHLHGKWTFTELGDSGSKIALDIEFDFSNRVLGAVVGPIFGFISDGMVDAFMRRAESVYG
ncbi:MAG: type II toxin-antitoxin system RatA family toxin [Gammaproteobacteria bacterium]|nr:type II toxin-antitoxin system RatA family toxin [Gammaproteobacteria bacterium]